MTKNFLDATTDNVEISIEDDNYCIFVYLSKFLDIAPKKFITQFKSIILISHWK
jgi:hypothetical protein